MTSVGNQLIVLVLIGVLKYDSKIQNTVPTYLFVFCREVSRRHQLLIVTFCNPKF